MVAWTLMGVGSGLWGGSMAGPVVGEHPDRRVRGPRVLVCYIAVGDKVGHAGAYAGGGT